MKTNCLQTRKKDLERNKLQVKLVNDLDIEVLDNNFYTELLNTILKLKNNRQT